MSAVRSILEEAPSRGIHVRLDGDQLVIGGAANEQFLRWASKHKPEILAELSARVPHEDEVFAALVRLCDTDRARLIEHARPAYLARVRIEDWRKAADLSDWHFADCVEALQLRGRVHQIGTCYMPAGSTPVPPGYCTKCNGGGCRVCDFFGLIQTRGIVA